MSENGSKSGRYFGLMREGNLLIGSCRLDGNDSCACRSQSSIDVSHTVHVLRRILQHPASSV